MVRVHDGGEDISLKLTENAHRIRRLVRHWLAQAAFHLGAPGDAGHTLFFQLIEVLDQKINDAIAERAHGIA
jgi:hypothetical protein